MDGHIAMEEWKDPNPGPECLMPSFLTEAFPPGGMVEDGSHGGKAGFEKHGLPAAASSPKKEVKPLPMTPHFGQSSSLAERMQARAGFSVTKLSMPCIPPAAADGAPPGAPSPYLTIPPGLSPATLLESPVFLSNAMGQASPTTGKLLMLGVTNDNGPIRFEGPSIEGPGAFSFKSLELKSSQYIAEEKKESLSNKQHASVPSGEVYVKTETNIQTAQEANLLGHLNPQQLNAQSLVKNGSAHDSKLNRLPSGTVAGSDNASPPDHGQPSREGDAKGDYPAMATAATPAEDGYSWRKYGQKQVKHSEYPRSYYKCTHPNCQVKKKVERSHEGHITEIIYKGMHGHQKPAQSRRPGTQMDASDNNPPGSQPNVVEARSSWHNCVAGEDWRGDGLEATSSPSVPGELCDSAASMQVHDGAARFESPEGVDGTSAVSDEVDGDDGVQARGSMSQNAADAEGDELESKRRKLESCAVEMGAASRAVREPRVVIQTTSEVDILDDGYRWRKYGQKVVKGNPNPRSYYKCTHPGCMVRKHVERASHDLKSVITTYEGKHNHEVPAARNSGHPSAVSGGGVSQPHAVAGGARRPEPPLGQDGLMRLGSCGAPLAAFGLPPRDPLAPMSNFPYSLGNAAALPSLPMPSGLGAVEGLKLPTLAPSLHPLLRHRQAMETAGLMVPKGEAMPSSATGASAAPPFQHMLGRLPVRHQM